MTDELRKSSPEQLAEIDRKYGDKMRKALGALGTLGSNAGSTTESNASSIGSDSETVEVPKPSYKSAGDLINECPELRPVLIDGLLRERETMNLVAASKKGKTYLLIYICLCVATGRAIFGVYPVKKAKVLMIDNELHKETLARRINDVARAMGLMREDFEDMLFADNLRGQVCDLFRMRSYFNRIQHNEFGLITLDAWYRMIPPKESENDNAVVTRMLNEIDAHAERIGAAFLIIHHASKGDQSGKSVTDMGSGAGAQSRAVDTHAVLRQHDIDNVAVLDAAVRSFKPVDPFCIEWSFPMWKPRLDLDAAQLKQPGRRKAAAAVKTGRDDAKKEDDWTVEKFVQMFLTSEPRDKKTVMASADMAQLSVRRAENFIVLAMESRLIHRWTYENDRTVYLANRPQTVLETVANDVTHTHTHSPHTPQSGDKRPLGRGKRARKKDPSVNPGQSKTPAEGGRGAA